MYHDKKKTSYGKTALAKASMKALSVFITVLGIDVMNARSTHSIAQLIADFDIPTLYYLIKQIKRPL